MHELSIAESICRSIRTRVGAARVDDLIVQVGALSGVNRDALEFCLSEAAELFGMKLGRFAVELVPAQAACACGNEFTADDLLAPCPKCGEFSRTLTGGEDVVISRLVVVEEDAEEDPTA